MSIPEDMTPVDFTGVPDCPNCAGFERAFVGSSGPRTYRITTLHQYIEQLPYTQESPLPPTTPQNEEEEITKLGEVTIDGKVYQIQRQPSTGEVIILKLNIDRGGSQYSVETRVYVAENGLADAEYKHCIRDYEAMGLAVIKSFTAL